LRAGALVRLARADHGVRRGDDRCRPRHAGGRPLAAWNAAVRSPLALALLLVAFAARAEPAVVASGSYPEGLLWRDGKLYFTEMGADRVTVIENGVSREFWSLPGCGPTQIVPFGAKDFVVDCHLGRGMVEVSAAGKTGRKFLSAPSGARLQD